MKSETTSKTNKKVFTVNILALHTHNSSDKDAQIHTYFIVLSFFILA